jgi:hypothetical protein
MKSMGDAISISIHKSQISKEYFKRVAVMVAE